MFLTLIWVSVKLHLESHQQTGDKWQTSFKLDENGFFERPNLFSSNWFPAFARNLTKLSRHLGVGNNLSLSFSDPSRKFLGLMVRIIFGKSGNLRTYRSDPYGIKKNKEPHLHLHVFPPMYSTKEPQKTLQYPRRKAVHLQPWRSATKIKHIHKVGPTHQL